MQLLYAVLEKNTERATTLISQGAKSKTLDPYFKTSPLLAACHLSVRLQRTLFTICRLLSLEILSLSMFGTERIRTFNGRSISSRNLSLLRMSMVRSVCQQSNKQDEHCKWYSIAFSWVPHEMLTRRGGVGSGCDSAGHTPLIIILKKLHARMEYLQRTQAQRSARLGAGPLRGADGQSKFHHLILSASD